MPRVMGQFQNALKDAHLHEIADFMDVRLPGWRDAVPAMVKTVAARP